MYQTFPDSIPKMCFALNDAISSTLRKVPAYIT